LPRLCLYQYVTHQDLHSFPTRRSSDLVEQLCIALIYKYMHYHPTHFHLGYLFDLCKSFTNIGEEIFPRQSEEDQELFQILSRPRSEEHTSELQSRENIVCRLLLEKKKR